MISAVTGQTMSPAQVATAEMADLQADAAISMITAPKLAANPLSAIPADFSRVMGYTPAIAHLANGTAIAINPNGGCSVIGGGRPFDLDLPCKAHDLGYDLLRYAHRHGEDLGPKARQRVDAKFGKDLNAQCDATYSGSAAQACDMVAASFDAGVGFNSWRQGFGAPVAAAGLVRTVGVIAILGLAILFGVRTLTLWLVRRIRGRRQLRLNPAQLLAAQNAPPPAPAS
jgi:hypothetical protein